MIDPCTKLVGVEYLIIESHKNIGYERDIHELVNDIITHLDIMYSTYEDIYGNK